MKKYKSVTNEDKARYDEDGYVIIRSMYSNEEVNTLLETYQKDSILKDHTYGVVDKDGHTTKLALWYSLDDNIYSAFARSQRMVDGVRKLIGGEPAHFHTKIMQKEPRVGGAWEWHQDYGYWYHDGFMYPYMLSVMIAITAGTKENGCLQVVKGSQMIGRIEHGMSGGQRGADQERVVEALKNLELVHVKVQPGDTLFFHSNLLHRSDMNKSDRPRWSMISTFNRITNKPYKEHNVSCITPMQAIPNEYILTSMTGGVSAKVDFRQ